MNILEAVGSRDKHNLTQVERCPQKVVCELVILGGVQHLQEGSSWVTSSILSHLIDLVK